MDHISGTSRHPASPLYIVCAYAVADHICGALGLLFTCRLIHHVRLAPGLSEITGQQPKSLYFFPIENLGRNGGNALR